MVACCLLLSFISRTAFSGEGGVEEKAKPLSGCSARLHPIVGEKPAGFPRQLASLPELEPVKKRLASEPSETNLRKPLPSSGN